MALRDARWIAGEALKQHGAWPPADSAPDPEVMARALEALSMIVDEQSGTDRCPWLISQPIRFPLKPNEHSFKLLDRLEGQVRRDEFYLLTEVAVIRQGRALGSLAQMEKYEYLGTPDKHRSGVPDSFYLDREVRDPTMYVYPTPADDQTELQILFQRYSPDVLAEVSDNTPPTGEVEHGFEQTWQRYLVLRTAHDCGCGRVSWLEDRKLRKLKDEYTEAEERLQGFSNRLQRQRHVVPETGYAIGRWPADYSSRRRRSA